VTNASSDSVRPAAALPVESFSTLLSKEIERSRRYYRGFALMRVEWAGERRPERTRSRAVASEKTLGAPAPQDPGPAEWMQALSQSLRRADVLARAPEGALYILLPETPASGIGVVRRRIEDLLSGAGCDAVGREESAPVILEAAYPRDGETPGELLEALSHHEPR
jgi:hypothetical protein